jgi:hypothetical protein
MDTNQRILMAEYEQRIRQDELLRTADRWYLTGDLPAEPTMRAALAELLFGLAAWIAPAGEIKEHARALARG